MKTFKFIAAAFALTLSTSAFAAADCCKAGAECCKEGKDCCKEKDGKKSCCCDDMKKGGDHTGHDMSGAPKK
ncbi:hypothetical protein [Sphingomonas baiyangensis]|uniref:Metallothionein n=1 Tax=Sphingomonas baiyangensis TaxID=2572576 RepID=A0A4U1L565_9SPHN|nr:hypothetical protein [Sphingomonas baiyangensis]TKD51423.1 hypothetical protein FBR43_12170 [Sphingomonas baiyangensis]